MNKKLKHKELFRFWTQSKGKHSNITSEYFQKSETCGCRDVFFLIENLDNTFTFILEQDS